MASAAYLTTLNQILSRITLYVPYCTIIVGSTGGILNLVTFTAKQLRQNSCGLYFLFSSIFDLFYLGFGATVRLMMDHYPFMIPSASPIFCKLRSYLSVLTPTLAAWFLVWSAIDRCMRTSPSAKWRRLSDERTARLIIGFSIVFYVLCYSHILAYYDVQLRNAQTLSYACTPLAGVYTAFISVFFLVLNGGSYLAMIIASWLTLKHVRASRQRVAPQMEIDGGRFPSIDRHLIRIMLFQVGVGVLLSSFRVVVLAYSLLTNQIPKSVERSTIESFIEQLSLMIFYINFAKSFFVNMLTSPLYRRIFVQRVISFWHLAHLQKPPGQFIQLGPRRLPLVSRSRRPPRPNDSNSIRCLVLNVATSCSIMARRDSSVGRASD